MSQAHEVIDLDYDSPLENLFWFLGNPWCMGLSFFGTWFMFVSPGKNNTPPIWPDFPVMPFFLIMLCVWAVGFWLKANYDVRYQLDAGTQQLDLVRKIFGQTFKSRIAEFSQLQATAVLSTWSDDKQGNRSWRYALALVTKAGRMVRVSSYSQQAPTTRASEIAHQVGIQYFQHQPATGTLTVRRTPEGEIKPIYIAAPLPVKPASQKPLSSGAVMLILSLVAIVIFIFIWALSHS
ncbi:MAG: hypothetical protein U0931_23755 [Vulcanimicrobiota bacterium]